MSAILSLNYSGIDRALGSRLPGESKAGSHDGPSRLGELS
jgi:hypothetical protein